jgi:hypothetical protein
MKIQKKKINTIKIHHHFYLYIKNYFLSFFNYIKLGPKLHFQEKMATVKRGLNPPVNVLRKYLCFSVYYVAFIDVLIDIEKY